LLVAIDDRDPGAGGGKCPAGRGADATGPTGDDGDLPAQFDGAIS
jgi:hypothetical protein